jgi:MSHA biogenesis protein MshK
MDRTVKYAGLLWLLALPVLAGARQLSDPTRPPASLGAAGTAEADDGTPPPARLQSILISRTPGGRRLAVIDGVTVRAGAKVGDAVLDRINDTSVVLRRGKNLETLPLFPQPVEAATQRGKP